MSQAVRKTHGDDGTFCLTTLQCAYDRQRLLKKIRKRLHLGVPCRVISTSLIEAGVDVDFPVAYREQTGLDSILQTAGRCNREGRSDSNSCLVHVFATDEGRVSFLAQNVAAFNAVCRQTKDLASQEAIRLYFTNLLTMYGEEALDSNHILEAHEKGIDGCFMPFAAIANSFKLIDTQTKPVYIPLNEEAARLCSLLADPKNYTRKLFRILGQYAVNLWPGSIEKLKKTGKLLPLASSIGSDTAAFVLIDMSIYDSFTGLIVSEDSVPQNGLFS